MWFLIHSCCPAWCNHTKEYNASGQTEFWRIILWQWWRCEQEKVLTKRFKVIFCHLLCCVSVAFLYLCFGNWNTSELFSIIWWFPFFSPIPVVFCVFKSDILGFARSTGNLMNYTLVICLMTHVKKVEPGPLALYKLHFYPCICLSWYLDQYYKLLTRNVVQFSFYWNGPGINSLSILLLGP